MIEQAVRRPVATAALYTAFLALGVVSLWRLPVELLPDVEHPRLTVRAGWTGASPEAMEASVTARIEAAARRVRGVDSIASISRADPGGAGARAEVTVRFAPHTRMKYARLDLGERVAELRSQFPPGVRASVEPYVPEEFAPESRELLRWRLHGPYTDDRLARLAADVVEPRLRALEGVAQVTVRGAERREVAVVLDRARIRQANLTPAAVRRRLAELQETRPVGSVRLAGREVAMSMEARAADVAELRDQVVATGASGSLRLGDVARVLDWAAEPRSLHRIDGRPAVSLHLYRQPGTHAIGVADRALAMMDSLSDALPPGVAMELERDASQDIRTQLTDLRLRALAAAAVILLVLSLFLRSPSWVLVVFGTIAFSVLVALNVLYLGGFTLNVLTLAGLAWGFGLVVDNGIVVAESVAGQLDRGKGRVRAAVDGARQVALPVAGATATTAVVLVPFLFLQGELRDYYVPLAWAVGVSVVSSLIVAFSFVPAMTAKVASGVARTAGVAGGEGGEPLYVRGYRALLEPALDRPLLVALVCAGALAASWRLFDTHVSRGVRWSDFWGSQTYLSVNIELPGGAALDRTDEMARDFEARLAAIPGVGRYETVVRPRRAQITVTFPDSVERTGVPVAVKERMAARGHRYSGARVRVFGYGPSFHGTGGDGPNYRVDVLGYDYAEVRRIARFLARRLERYGRVRDADPDASGWWRAPEPVREYVLAVDRQALAAHGVTVERLLSHVSAAVGGNVGRLRLRLGGEEVPVRLQLEGHHDFDLLGLRELRVPMGARRERSGAVLRLADVASVERRPGPSRIVRENQQYRRSVAWEFLGPRKLGDLVRDAVVGATGLPPGYEIRTDDLRTWSREEKGQVHGALVFAVLLVYMTVAAFLESLSAPLVVLLTLPLALIGVFLVFFYTGATFTRTAYIGAIMMGGVVVNNALLVVHRIEQRREGSPDREAIVEGTLERVRPILMTTLTTVLGLLPLVLFSAHQDENIWNAMALATIGGLTSSTFFVLVALPVAYRWVVARGRRRPRSLS